MHARRITLSGLFLALALLQTGTAMGFTAGTDPSLVGWWKLDDASGPFANDSSGNGNMGSIQGTPTWVAGILDGALLFNGTDTYINCGNAPSLQVQNQITMAFWIRTPGFTRNWAAIITKGDASWRMSRSSETGNSIHMGIGGTTTTGVPWFDASKPITDDQWHHVAGVYDGAMARIYIDGVQIASRAATGQLASSANNVLIGENEGGMGRLLAGTLDDVRIYNRGLTAEDLQIVMKGYKGPIAVEPTPADKATDVPRDIVLAWTTGPYAQTHDIYFGTVLADVNTATRLAPKGVLVSQDQTSATYDNPGLLTFGQTYYWRVDEVNAWPDSTIYRGPLWTFTAEPFAYPAKPVKVTASSSSTASMGPEKTIDGSGLNAQDQHSTASSAMWLSKATPAPAWIQYEFDQAYKLHQMWVWNSNQSMEFAMGYGAKDVLVETSLDAVAWTPVAGVPTFAQAPGKEGYAHNTTVEFGGTVAKHVRLTINKAWSGKAQTGLSEVRFLYIPEKAYGPQPANGATGVALDADLTWRPGREASGHTLYFGRDSSAVVQGSVPGRPLVEARYRLSDLSPEYGRTYAWRVDEFNQPAGQTWPGDAWSFTTIGYATVEDFESYDDVCRRIFFGWMDGYGHSGSPTCGIAPSNGNGTSSTVGNVVLPFAEQTIVHSGRQSMPMGFDNSRSPFYSEAIKLWDQPQSWTRGGANALTLYVQGTAAAFLETAPGSFIMNGMGTDIWGQMDEFRFTYKLLKGNGSVVARVDAVGNTHVSAKAGVMIRESLDPMSPYAMVDVTPGGGVAFERRTAMQTNSEATTQAGLGAPCWVKLTRSGNTLTAQRSSDGVTWTSITSDTAASTATVAMATDIYIGLAVTSHAANRVCGARFSNVSASGSGSWQVAEIGVAQAAGNSPEPFYVAIADSSGTMKIVTHPDPVVTATGQWEEWTIPLSEFTSAGVNMNRVYWLILGVGNRNAPRAGGAGMLYIDDIRLPRVGP